MIYADWDRATRVVAINYTDRTDKPRSPSRRLVAITTQQIRKLEDKVQRRKRREAQKNCQAILSVLRGERPT